MKKLITLIVLFITHLATSCPMKTEEHNLFHEIIRERVDLFFTAIKNGLAQSLSTYDSSNTLEFIAVYNHCNIVNFVTMALTIKNIPEETPIINLYILTDNARSKSRYDKNHWFYKALKNNVYTPEQLSLNKETYFEESNLFPYEKSKIFYDCTDQFTEKIIDLNKILKIGLSIQQEFQSTMQGNNKKIKVENFSL